MSYKKQFDLNLSDIDIIETCLRRELHHRSGKFQQLAGEEHADQADSAKHEVAEIREVLGKLHNQKIWFAGDRSKPWMPKG